MAVDLGVFGRLKSKADYDREAQAFELNKALTSAKLASAQRGENAPAAIQIANEFAKAREAGDLQRMNDIAVAAKSFDKGIYTGADGSFSELPGYGTAVGGIAAAKAGMAQQAKDNVRMVTEPIIASGQADARNASEFRYAPKIKGAETAATRDAGREADKQDALSDKTVKASTMIELIDQAEKILPKASSGTIGQIGAAGKGFLGVSDEATQADKQLRILSGALTGNVPRFEGPQGVLDVELYKQSAGDVANIALPIGDRLAGLKTMRDLQMKYVKPEQGNAADVFGEAVPQGGFNETLLEPLPAKQPTPVKANKYQQGEVRFNLKKAGYTDAQVDAYMDARGLK